MKVIISNLRFCADCSCVAANGDDSGIESEKIRKLIHKNLTDFGLHLVPDCSAEEYAEKYPELGVSSCEEFTCDCCHRESYGDSHFFAILAEQNESTNVREIERIRKKLGHI